MSLKQRLKEQQKQNQAKHQAKTIDAKESQDV
jgi:hypothetical protein